MLSYDGSRRSRRTNGAMVHMTFAYTLSVSCRQAVRRRSAGGPRLVGTLSLAFLARALARQGLRMNVRQPRLRRLVASAARDPLRSPLFHWLYANHLRLAATLAGRRIDWQPLIATAAKAGATDASGGQPSEHTMRRTWRNVCALVAAREAARAADEAGGRPTAMRKHNPRDLPASAKPREVAPSPPAVAGGGRFDRPSAFATDPKAIVNAENPSPKELMEGLRRVLDEASGRR